MPLREGRRYSKGHKTSSGKRRSLYVCLSFPRDLSGKDLSVHLNKFGYRITRQTGSHLRLTSVFMGFEHHITIPAHDPLKVGTLNGILKDIANYLKIGRDTLIKDLFESN